MNEKTRAVISEYLVDIYHGNAFIGTVCGQVTRIGVYRRMKGNCFLLHVHMDDHCTGVIIADVIQKGD